MFCSIIIPLYNKAAFIEDAIHSVLKQTYQNFEILVVDDGSKDDGPNRVRNIQDQRVHLIQQVNSGVSQARNTGIAQCRGDLVCFLDADDWYQPQFLETIIKMTEQFPEHHIFTTYYKLVNLSRGEQRFWPIDIKHFEIIEDLFRYWHSNVLFNIDSIAIKRPFLLQFQPCFPIGEQMGEDQDLYFRMIEKSSIVYCSTPLTAYRMQIGDSLCATYQGNAMFPAYQRLEQRALSKQMPERLRGSAIKLAAENRITDVRRTLILGNRYQAVKELLTAWRGMVSKRWWVSLVMCLFVPPRVVRQWENWRLEKKRKEIEEALNQIS